MVGKRIQFDDETWEALQAVARQSGRTFQQLADEAFAELLRRYGQPVGLKAALRAVFSARNPRENAHEVCSCSHHLFGSTRQHPGPICSAVG
jgi:hypothetical protein